MRTIERASAFKKDFKRVKASPRHARDIDVMIATIVAMLVVDRPLPESNRDHALGGDWRGYLLNETAHQRELKAQTEAQFANPNIKAFLVTLQQIEGGEYDALYHTGNTRSLGRRLTVH